MRVLEVKTKVLPGGGIKFEHPDLPEGREVTVQTHVEDERPKRRISDILANYPGGQLFKSAEEIDLYLKEERDSWER